MNISKASSPESLKNRYLLVSLLIVFLALVLALPAQASQSQSSATEQQQQQQQAVVMGNIDGLKINQDQDQKQVQLGQTNQQSQSTWYESAGKNYKAVVSMQQSYPGKSYTAVKYLPETGGSPLTYIYLLGITAAGILVKRLPGV